MPIRSPHKKNAELLMNFYYQPEIAAQVEDYVNYISPVVGTDEAMKDRDPDLLENDLVFPDRGDPEQGQGVHEPHRGSRKTIATALSPD